MRYFIPLGYNWIVSEKHGGTQTRCNTLLKIIRFESLLQTEFHFILVAGTPPGSNRKVSMAAQMAQYITHISQNTINPTPTPFGWGTLAEIQGAILQIGSFASLHPKVQPEVYICTNLGHMPRVKMYWWALAPKEWRVTFVPARDQSFTKMEWLQEAGKVMRDIYRIATGKIKRTAT